MALNRMLHYNDKGEEAILRQVHDAGLFKHMLGSPEVALLPVTADGIGVFLRKNAMGSKMIHGLVCPVVKAVQKVWGPLVFVKYSRRQPVPLEFEDIVYVRRLLIEAPKEPLTKLTDEEMAGYWPLSAYVGAAQGAS